LRLANQRKIAGLAHPFPRVSRCHVEEEKILRRLVMKTIMVRYKTSEAHADSNEALVRAVFNELRSRAPEGLRYATYRLADGVTFIHIATLETPDKNPLADLPSFKAFQKQLKDRCVEPPVFTELSAVDSYGSVA
jgi:hypothetical protein